VKQLGGASLASAKYEAVFTLEVDGPVDRADIVGALFGQTEGLFTEDYDLRELQEKGKVGRIQINSENKGKKTVGEIIVPSNMTKEETAFVAAIIESVDKVGPYTAKIELREFRDLREAKRQEILKRTKQIIEKQREAQNVGSVEEALGELMNSVKSASIENYGASKLPAGPEVDKSEEVILVEGRADVVNLLKHGYKNAVAIGGATGGNVPAEILQLGKKKTITAFLDGDRGGDMILRELEEAGVELDYVARAPPGKEVEELTGKEIARALDSKEPYSKVHQVEQETVEQAPPAEQLEEETGRQRKKEVPKPVKATTKVEERVEVADQVKEAMESVRGTLEALLLDASLKQLDRIPVGDLAEKLSEIDPGTAFAVVFDGVITQRLADVASEKGVKMLVGARKGNITKNPIGVAILEENQI